MFIKKKNYKLLDKSIEDLSSTLEKANIKENSRRPGRMTRRDSFIWHESRKAGVVKLTTPIFQK